MPPVEGARPPVRTRAIQCVKTAIRGRSPGHDYGLGGWRVTLVQHRIIPKRDNRRVGVGVVVTLERFMRMSTVPRIITLSVRS
jgi:hypothetical protein